MDSGVTGGQKVASVVKWKKIWLDRGQKWCTAKDWLGPLLFTIFIDDNNEEVLHEISKFADDTKISSRVNAFNDIR